MNDRRTINLEPNHCEIEVCDIGFKWTFFARTESGNKYKIVMRFSLWWIGYLARDLWKMIAKKQEQIDSIKKQLSGAP